MKDELDIIEIENPDLFICLIKDQATTIMSHAYNELDRIIHEPEEDRTPEEFEVIKRKLMLDLIDEVKSIKHNLFKNTLDSYNDMIIEMNRFKARFQDEQRESELMKEYINGSMKRTIIISAGVSILLPGLIPLVLIYDIPKLGFDSVIKKYHNNRIENNKMTNEIFETIQDPFFEFMDTLRTDYHHSNKVFKELEERACNGEDIINDLKELMNPERVGLELENEEEKVYLKEKK